MAEPSMSKGTSEEAIYECSTSSDQDDEEIDDKVDSDDDPGVDVTATDYINGIKEVKAAKKLTSKRRKVVTCCASSEHSRAVEVVVSNDDLITEILFLVPAKPLLKFKCVSKHWRSLISESHFASSHACRNTSSTLISGLYFYHYKTWQLKSVTIDGRLSLPTLPFFDTIREGTLSRVVDSCNGLLLYFCGDKMHYIVCNLTTQKYIVLPKPGGSTTSRPASDLFGAYLAFDPAKSPYYKVVLIDYRYGRGQSSYVIEIYSSEIASWKVIRIEAPEGSSYRSGVFWNGAIHWLSCTNVHIRFNIDAENLTETPMPKVPNILAEDKIRYFGECGGRLLLIQTREYRAMGFRVLEMEKDSCRWNVKCRVNLRYIASVFPHGHCPLYSVLDCVNGATEKDFTLVLAIPRKVIACNLTRKTVKVLLDLQGDSHWPCVHYYRHAFRFVESLYPL